MSYSVDWITKVITIPTADLTLVSGTRYSLDMADFLAEVRRLEWGFSGGLWALAILDHTNTKLDFAGANYAPFDEIINGYTVEITGAATRVDLLGSNNNLVDILISNGVSVVPSNSAGLQIVGGGGASVDDIAAAVWNHVISGFKARSILHLILSFVGLKASGAGTGKMTFNNLSATKAAEVDHDGIGNRTGVTITDPEA